VPNPPISDSRALEQFRAALRDHGLIAPNELIADGQIHRCDVKKGSDGWPRQSGKGDGSYVLHLNAHIPYGGFQNWTDGRGWQSWRPNLKREFTAEERQEIGEAIERARSEHARYKAEVHAEARVKAKRMWRDAEAASDSHEYCERKQVKPVGLRMIQFRDGDMPLLVPMYDEDEKLQNLQFIHRDGRKHGLRGGDQTDCHFWIAKPEEVKSDRKIICLAEGWATGETIYQAKGCATVIGFGASNLPTVAEWLHQHHPDYKIRVFVESSG
jgi:putative DNA primase/helicase